MNEIVNALILWYREIIIVFLVLFLVLYWVKTRRLKRRLIQATRKQFIPVLLLDIDPRKPGIFIKNEGNCYVKDITVSDIHVILDYDFKKELTLKFNKVGFIKPKERIKVDYSVFDGDVKIPSSEAEHLNVHLAKSVFEIHLICANIEGKEFKAVLIKDKEGFHIKEIVPV